jgi:hypothetical protein
MFDGRVIMFWVMSSEKEKIYLAGRDRNFLYAQKEGLVNNPHPRKIR